MSRLHVTELFDELKLQAFHCCARDCDAFMVTEKKAGFQTLLTFRCEGLERCDRCKDSFCEEHFEQQKDDDGLDVCVFCAHPEKEEEEEEEEQRKRARDEDDE
jgi:hypothetical protein